MLTILLQYFVCPVLTGIVLFLFQKLWDKHNDKDNKD